MADYLHHADVPAARRSENMRRAEAAEPVATWTPERGWHMAAPMRATLDTSGPVARFRWEKVED